MDIVKLIEIFALATGVPYIVLEILQKNTMWYFGIATGLACAYSFAIQGLWSNMALNLYYVAMSLWGLYLWRRDSRTLEENAGGQSTATVHLVRLDASTALCSAGIFIAGVALLAWLPRVLGVSSNWLDAVSAMMSVIATYWLARSIPYHWVIWLVADSILVVMCFLEGQYWLTLLYAAYVAAAIYGMFHWLRKGKYID